MPTRAKLYAASVVALAAICLAGSLLTAKTFAGDQLKFGHCLALALLTATFKVRLPGMRSSISASFVLFLIAIAHFSMAAAVMLTIPCTVLQILWRARRKPRTIQVVFSVASTIVSTTVAAILFQSLNHPGATVPALIVGATAFFFTNSLLVATILGLDQSISIGACWRDYHRWAFPYYMGGAIIAALVTGYSQVCGFHGALAMVPLVYSLYSCYRTYIVVQPDGTATA